MQTENSSNDRENKDTQSVHALQMTKRPNTTYNRQAYIKIYEVTLHS